MYIARLTEYGLEVDMICLVGGKSCGSKRVPFGYDSLKSKGVHFSWSKWKTTLGTPIRRTPNYEVEGS